MMMMIWPVRKQQKQDGLLAEVIFSIRLQEVIRARVH